MSYHPPTLTDPVISNNNNNNQHHYDYDPHHRWSIIPVGWTIMTSPEDGRIYYWEKDTGRTSWVHPNASTNTNTAGSPPPPPPPPPPMSAGPTTATAISRTEYLDTPWNASRRPENHQCYAVTALILCFPIGIFALIHSILVDRAWKQGRYGDAVNHSRQTQQYSCFGTFLGICFWIYWFFVSKHQNNIMAKFINGEWWPDWNLFD